MSIDHCQTNAAPATLVDLLRLRAQQQPDHRAYTFLCGGADESTLTYAELDQLARQVAALIQNQAARGERALLIYPSGLDYVVAFFGCLYAGIIAVPIFPPNPAHLDRTISRLCAIFHDAAPTIALTIAAFQSHAPAVVTYDPAFQSLRWLATDAEAIDAAAWRDPAIDSDTLAFLQYTSGSTAAPKGVMVSHGNLLHNEALIQRAFAVTKDSIIISWLPLYHDMGLIGTVLQPLYAEAHCIMMPPADFLQKPFCWLQAISRYHATISGGPNFAYDLCTRKISSEQRASLDLQTWNVAFNGAEPIHPETLERFATTFAPCGFRREAFFPCYGLAEATLFVSGGPVDAAPITLKVSTTALEHHQIADASTVNTSTRLIVSSGQIWPEQQIAIVAPDTGKRCSPDQVGEVWMTGPSVAQGYWQQPETTRQTFQAHLAGSGDRPYLRSGDLGFVQDDRLFIVGRIKDLIIIRGRNHAPQDIEYTAAASHWALRPGCGVAFSVDIAGEERLVIAHEIERQYRILYDNRADSPSEREAAAAEVASAMRATVSEQHELQVYDIVLLPVGAVPKTSSGKLQRQACRAAYLASTLPVLYRSTSVLPANETEPLPDVPPLTSAALLEVEQALRLPLLVAYLQQQVAREVGVPPSQVSLDQPFMAAGLDSLKVLELKQRIEVELAVDVSLERFIEYPTITQLAGMLLDALEQSIGDLWAEITQLTEEEVDVRLAQLIVKERQGANS